MRRPCRAGIGAPPDGPSRWPARTAAFGGRSWATWGACTSHRGPWPCAILERYSLQPRTTSPLSCQLDQNNLINNPGFEFFFVGQDGWLVGRRSLVTFCNDSTIASQILQCSSSSKFPESIFTNCNQPTSIFSFNLFNLQMVRSVSWLVGPRLLDPFCKDSTITSEILGSLSFLKSPESICTNQLQPANFNM